MTPRQRYMRPTRGASPDASCQKRIKCDPYVTPSPTYLEAPTLPEPTTALMFDKNSSTDTHDNDAYTYNIKLILHTIFFVQWHELNTLMPHQCHSVYKCS